MKFSVLLGFILVVYQLPIFSQTISPRPQLYIFKESPRSGIIREYEDKEKYNWLKPGDLEIKPQQPGKEDRASGSEDNSDKLTMPYFIPKEEHFSDKMKYLDPTGNYPMTIKIPEHKERFSMPVK